MLLLKELKRRNVFRVAIAYLITAWLLLQVVDLVLENINSPDWMMLTMKSTLTRPRYSKTSWQASAPVSA